MSGVETQYKRGAIKSLKLKNFLTFGSNNESPHEFPFAPRVNIVCGPNGLGKSSLVAAIVLCCGGDKTFMKRGKTLADFIRSGADKAEIELTLHDPTVPAQEVRFKKTYSRPPNKNIFMVDDLDVGQAVYRLRLKELNIHPGSLMQFLPQDRVTELGDLKEEELLLATEEALGADSHEMHQELIHHRREWLGIAAELKAMKPTSDLVATKKGTLDSELRKFRQQDKEKERMMSLRLKLLILRIKEAERQKEACAIEEAAALAVKQRLEGLMVQLKIHVEKMQQRLGIPVSMLPTHAVGEDLEKLQGLLTKDKSSKSEAAIELNRITALRAHEIAEQRHDDKVALLRQEISMMETEMSQAPDSMNASRRVDEADVRTLRQTVQELQQREKSLLDHLQILQAAEQNLSGKMASLRESTESQLQRLKHLASAGLISSDVITVFQTIRSQPEKYASRVIGPLFLMVSATEETYVKYLETAFGKELNHFLCDSTETMKEMNQEFRIRQNLQCSFAVTPPQHGQERRGGFTCSEQRALLMLGFSKALSDVFLAPEPVKTFLNTHFTPDCILINSCGDDQSADSLVNYWRQVKSVPANYRLRFFTEDCLYEELNRRNSGIVKQRPLVEPCLLQFDSTASESERKKSLWEAEIIETERKLSEERMELKTVQLNLVAKEDELSALEAEMSEIDRTMFEAAAVQEVLTRKKEQLDINLNVERKPRADTTAEEEINKKILSINLRRASMLTSLDMDGSIANLEALSTYVHEGCNVVTTLLGSVLGTSGAFQRFHFMTKEKKKIETRISEIQARAHLLDVSIQEIKERIRLMIKELYLNRDKGAAEVQAIFKSLHPLKTPAQVTKALAEAYGNYLRMLSDKVDAAALHDEENSVAADHSKAARDWLKKSFDLKVSQASHLSLKEQWLTKLRSDVDLISEKVGHMFARLGYEGRVVLVEPAADPGTDDAVDYEAYGLDIETRFRDSEPFAKLSGRQSGGERVVSIAIFLLALQQCSDVPFRIVDELNQGMDNTNERNIFQLVLDASANSDTQYISCSPKISPDYESNNPANLNFCFLMKVHDNEVPQHWSAAAFCRALQEFQRQQAEYDEQFQDNQYQEGDADMASEASD